MRKIRSRLKNGGTPIMLVCFASLFLVICICVLLTNHLHPRYGFRVNPASTQFTMGTYHRENSHIVSVAAGDVPRLYNGSKIIPDGMNGFDAFLDDLKQQSTSASAVTIILVVDSAVAAGTVQQLTDQILAHGFNCSYAGVPALN